MSYTDFLLMDADAFDAVATAYHDQEENRRREEWERMRLLATISIQPHLSKNKKITPEKLIPLPWDHEKHNSSAMSAEEQRQRMKELVEQLGDKTV